MHDLEAAHDAGMQGEDDSKPSGSPKQHKAASSHTHSTATHTGSKEDKGHEAEVHEHRVIGGLKATLKRDGVSEEAKEHARERLEEMGIDVDKL
ncbi:hypothetical protein JCM8547_008116 [Rhodosporidiobolus lusitaniae]